jgi:hypothetical protein
MISEKKSFNDTVPQQHHVFVVDDYGNEVEVPILSALVVDDYGNALPGGVWCTSAKGSQATTT